MADYLKATALALSGVMIIFGMFLVLLLAVVDVVVLRKKFRWAVLVRLIFFGIGETGLGLAFIQIVEQAYRLMMN